MSRSPLTLAVTALSFLCIPAVAFAADAIQSKSGIPDVALQIPIGTLKNANITTYIQAAYSWIIGAAAVLAVLLIMIAGVRWLTAGGSGRSKEATTAMWNALAGLALILGSYLLLYTLNPRLVQITDIDLTPIKEIGLPPESAAAWAAASSTNGSGIPTAGIAGKKCAGTAPWNARTTNPDPQKLNTMLADNPYLKGKGPELVALSQRYNIDVGLALGIWAVETKWNTDIPKYSSMYNPGNVTSTGCQQGVRCPTCGSNGACMTNRCWACFPTFDKGMEAWFSHAAKYGNLTIKDALNAYAPPFENPLTKSGEYVDLIGGTMLKVASLSNNPEQDVANTKQKMGCQ